MYLDCHAMLGWTIGNLVPGDARLRRWATAAALLPDIDGLPVVFGTQYYGEFHHTFGHNVFLWVAVSALAAYRLRTLKAGLVVFACFGSHLQADAYFSGLNQYPFWPVSWWAYAVKGGYSLFDPINTQLGYVGLVLVFLLALVYRRTPIELFSPRLDHLLVSLCLPRTLRCRICERKTNQQCACCGDAVCWRHAAVTRPLRVTCPACAASARLANTPGHKTKSESDARHII